MARPNPGRVRAMRWAAGCAEPRPLGSGGRSVATPCAASNLDQPLGVLDDRVVLDAFELVSGGSDLGGPDGIRTRARLER